MKKFNKIITTIAALSILVSPLNVLALNKDETVFTNLDSTGKVTKSTVTNHLSFIGSNEVQDETYLKDLLNVNGKENFTLSNNNLKWENKGKDIYYQGKIEKEMPIKTDIKYYLNGKEYKLDELKGKSGNVKIKINLTNTLKNTVKVNGKTKTLYTPFVTTVGTVLDENSSNVKISNGKVISTGSRNMAVGIAAPGLYDSINIDEFETLDKITIEYSTTKFNLSTIYLVSTPKLLDNSDFDIFDKMDDLYLKINELQINMNKIEKGAKDLEVGSNKLATGSDKITSSLKEVNEGIAKLKSGTKDLDDGVSSIIKELSGAKKSLEDAANDAGTKISSLKKLKTQNTSAMDTIKTKTNSAASLSYDVKTYVVIGNVASQLQAGESPTNISWPTPLDDTTKSAIISLISNPAYTEVVTNASIIYLLYMNNTAISSTIDNLVSTQATITNLVNSLSDALDKVHTGTTMLDQNVGVLKSGMNQIYAGSKELNTGVKTLNTGIKTLHQGTKEFNDKGIKKLSDYAKKLKEYSDTAKALKKLSKNYKGYGSSNADNTVFVSVIKEK